jgi:hypothetical protein
MEARAVRLKNTDWTPPDAATYQKFMQRVDPARVRRERIGELVQRSVKAFEIAEAARVRGDFVTEAAAWARYYLRLEQIEHLRQMPDGAYCAQCEPDRQARVGMLDEAPQYACLDHAGPLLERAARRLMES